MPHFREKFTSNPHHDSEGFVIDRPNPKGWDEVDGVKLPSVSPWAQISDADLETVHAWWSRQVLA
jgi:hypothetical protein